MKTSLKNAGSKKIGVKRESKGFDLKSANPRPGYLKSIEFAVREVAISCERKK